MVGLDPYGFIDRWLRAARKGAAAEARAVVEEARARDPVGVKHALHSRIEAAAALGAQTAGEEAAHHRREEALLRELLSRLD